MATLPIPKTLKAAEQEQTYSVLPPIKWQVLPHATCFSLQAFGRRSLYSRLLPNSPVELFRFSSLALAKMESVGESESGDEGKRLRSWYGSSDHQVTLQSFGNLVHDAASLLMLLGVLAIYPSILSTQLYPPAVCNVDGVGGRAKLPASNCASLCCISHPTSWASFVFSLSAFIIAELTATLAGRSATFGQLEVLEKFRQSVSSLTYLRRACLLRLWHAAMTSRATEQASLLSDLESSQGGLRRILELSD